MNPTINIYRIEASHQAFAVCDCGWKYGINYLDERSRANIEHAIRLHKYEHFTTTTAVENAIFHRVAVSYTKGDKYVGAQIHFNCACGWNVRFMGWNPWVGNGTNGAPINDVLAHFRKVESGKHSYADAQ